MPKEGQTIARLASEGLEARFDWRGDRVFHSVGALSDTTVDQMETPVYQEVHQQGDVCFLSGQTAGRHWSASVEPTEGGFLFDVACRVTERPPAVGSAYDGFRPEGLCVIGKAKAGMKMPTLRSSDGVLTIEAAAADEVPTTIRFSYAIVVWDSRWIQKESFGGGE